jgi:hypothetical protein
MPFIFCVPKELIRRSYAEIMNISVERVYNDHFIIILVLFLPVASMDTFEAIGNLRCHDHATNIYKITMIII